MYGVSPMIQVKTKSGNQSTGNIIDAFMWANASDTMVDVFTDPEHNDQKGLHWFSEAGSLEFFILTSASPQNLTRKMACLTGKP